MHAERIGRVAEPVAQKAATHKLAAPAASDFETSYVPNDLEEEGDRTQDLKASKGKRVEELTEECVRRGAVISDAVWSQTYEWEHRQFLRDERFRRLRRR